ncbi:heme oxygenase (biliverdin-IX-beta and delta-forming) [Gammaproteobacteria bacterium]
MNLHKYQSSNTSIPNSRGVTNPLPDDPNLRTWLRHRTHDCHVRLNRHPLLTGLTKPGYRMAAYQFLLAAYFHFYQAVEAGIKKFLAREKVDFDYTHRCKLPWLIADLQFLGIDPHDKLFSLQQPIETPEFSGLEHLIGILYVVEGATLGGQIISASLATTLSLTANQGACFFNGYGACTQDYWRQFEIFVKSVSGDFISWEPAGFAATSMFSSIEGLLDNYQARLDAK